MKTRYLQLVIIGCLLISVSVPAYAQVIRDGTIGEPGNLNLSGPDYDIKADYGHQAGANLFHSFNEFNINANESATFSGPDSVQNIISRITGGDSSWIDGVLRSTVSGADLYLLNPAGVMFGPNASLDISGSFHVSTADYLRLGESERFYTMPFEGEVLSTAAPTAFGFLDSDIAPITFEGKGEIADQELEADYNSLAVSQGKTISVIGGNIELKKGTYYYEAERKKNLPTLYAPEGRINMAGVASAGEIPAKSNLDVSSFETMGNLIITENSLISVSGEGAGSVVIRGGQFFVNSSVIEAETYGDRNGDFIDIKSDTLSLTNGSLISVDSYGTGNGADINIHTLESVDFSGENGNYSQIWANTSFGNSGSVLIETKNFSLNNGSYITTSSYGIGRGGDVTLRASESITLAGLDSSGSASAIDAGSNSIDTEAGDAGNIIMDTKKLSLYDGGQIQASTEGNGNGGDITIYADDSVYLSGNMSNGQACTIFTRTRGREGYTGNAGNITIQTKQLSLNDGALIETLSYGGGTSGNINIYAADSVEISGIDKLEESTPSRIVTAAMGKSATAGDAGDVLIETDHLSLTDGTQIRSSTVGAGTGGDITIRASESVNLTGNVPSGARGEGQGSSIVSNAVGQDEIAGNAGHIEIDTKYLSLNDGAQIRTATIGGGMGGNVTIHATESATFKGNNPEGYPVMVSVSSYCEEKYGGRAGNILIETKNLSLNDGTQVNSLTIGGGRGGDVTINASESVRFEGNDEKGGQGSKIASYTEGKDPDAGDAGNVEIETKYLSLNDGARIVGMTENTGEGGDVIIRASESVNFSGVNTKGLPNIISVGTYAEEVQGGNAGNVEIKTKYLSLNDGVQISTLSRGSGIGGDIIINASESVIFSGADGNGSASKILSLTEGKNPEMGDAGNIKFTAKDLSLNDGAAISASTDGTGNARNIELEVVNLHLNNGSSISSESGYIEGGDAGTITINATGSVIVKDKSSFTTRAEDAGGGRIDIYTKELLHLSDSKITTDVEKGADDAGDINIKNPSFVTLNDSNIIAAAYQGRGGNIHIVTDNFIKSSDSILNASSELGIDGQINIESPDTDISGGLTVLPSSFLDASRWLKDQCSERSQEDIPRFVLTGRDAIPTSPDDWGPSPPAAFEKETTFEPTGEPGKLLAQGENFFQEGDFQNAIQTWKKAIPLSEPQENLHLCTLIYLADAYQAIGHHQKALLTLFKASSRVSKSNNHAHKALFFTKLGDIFLSLRKDSSAVRKLNEYLKQENNELRLKGSPYILAKEYLEKGKQEARLADDPYVLATALNNMGNYLATETDYSGAIDYRGAMALYKQGLEYIEPETDILLKSKILINIAHARFEELGNRATENIFSEMDYKDIMSAMKEAYLTIKDLPDSHAKAFELISLSMLIQKIGKRYGKSDNLRAFTHQLLTQATQIAEKLGDVRMISYGYGLSGELYQQEKRYNEAVSLTRVAIFSAQQGDYPELSYLWQWQLGRVFKAEGDTVNAVKAYKSATDTLSPIGKECKECRNLEKNVGDRKEVSEKECKECDNDSEDSDDTQQAGIISELFKGYRNTKLTFDARIRPVYMELAELLMPQDDEQEKLREVRNTMDRLKIAELQEFYEDECVAAKQEDIEGNEHIPSHTALIYPVPLKDSLILLLGFTDGMKQINAPVDYQTLRAAAKDFNEILGDYSLDPYDSLARELYNWLIGPIEEELKDRKIETLVIVPDGPLRLIPFSALLDKNDQFLIQNYALATVPAISLTDFGESSDREYVNNLLGGLSEGKPPLPNVPKELEHIKSIIKGKILLNKDFTIKNLTDELKQLYFIIVMATHGKFGDTVDETYLETYDGRLTIDRLEKIIGFGKFREQQTDLLVLSACETAAGDERAALGLGGIAVKAGVRSAIATLWRVDDEASLMVNTEFFDQFKTFGVTKAKALQNAQKKLLSGKKYSHPSYWSPFLLIGNWF